MRTSGLWFDSMGKTMNCDWFNDKWMPLILYRGLSIVDLEK